MQRSQRTPVSRRAAPKRAVATSRRVPKKAARAKGSKIGSNVGRFLGEAAGSFIPIPGSKKVLGGLAEWAGNKLGTILGLGEYTLERNSIVNPGQQLPMMHKDTDFTVFRHRTYIGEVTASAVAGEYSVQYIKIQPGDKTFQPWGKGIFDRYSEWVPMGIVFEFESTTTENSGVASPNSGIVMMSTDYNAFEVDPFPDKISIENNFGTTKAKPTKSFYHPVECAPKRNVQDSFYIRAGALPPGQPAQLYDLGTFGIASAGCPVASQKLGELWCTWEMGVRRATMQNVSGSDIAMDLFRTSSSTPANPMGNLNTQIAEPDNSLGGTCGGNIYRFPVNLSYGTYRFSLKIVGSVASLATGAPSALTTTACTLIVGALDTTGTLSQINVPVNAGLTVQSIMVEAVVRITGPGATISFGNALGAALPTGTVSGTCIVQQWDNLIVANF